MSEKACAPRRHHFIPVHYLAGFTQGQTSDEPLWLFDLKRLMERRQVPRGVAHQRHFYRVEGAPTEEQAQFLEKLFARLESTASGVIRDCDARRGLPEGQQLEVLLAFIAALAMRTPQARSNLETSFQVKLREHVEELADSARRLPSMLQAIGEGTSPASVERWRARLRAGKTKLRPSRNFILQGTVEGTVQLAALMSRRHWHVVQATDENPLITSDAPVQVRWRTQAAESAAIARGEGMGFAVLGTLVSVPLTRRLGLIGVFEDDPWSWPHPVATMNSLTLEGATLFIAGQSSSFMELPVY